MLYIERGILHISPAELSLYCMQNRRLPTVHVRRYTLRPDACRQSPANRFAYDSS